MKRNGEILAEVQDLEPHGVGARDQRMSFNTI